MQISIVMLPWTLFLWHTSDNVPLSRHSVDNLQVFNMSIKDQN